MAQRLAPVHLDLAELGLHLLRQSGATAEEDGDDVVLREIAQVVPDLVDVMTPPRHVGHGLTSGATLGSAPPDRRTLVCDTSPGTHVMSSQNRRQTSSSPRAGDKDITLLRRKGLAPRGELTRLPKRQLHEEAGSHRHALLQAPVPRDRGLCLGKVCLHRGFPKIPTLTRILSDRDRLAGASLLCILREK